MQPGLTAGWRPPLLDPCGPSRAPPNCGRPICEAAPMGGRLALLTKTQLRDEIGVARFVFLAKIIEKRAALVDEQQQAPARMVVLRVGLEVLGQVVDALGEDRDLDFGRTGVRGPAGIVADDGLLAFGSNRHRPFLSKTRS